MLDSIITSKTRVKMLLKFFSNSHSTAYLREMAKEFDESTNSIRHELNNLSEAGYLLAREEGRNIYYRANTRHPLYPELKTLVHKYLGLDKILDNVIHKVLSRLGNLKLALITGDYAEGRDSGIIDLVMVGAVDKEYLFKCVEKVEALIQRKVRTLVLSEEEFEKNKKSLHAERALVLWQG
ncbi:MAG: winged helix-turn-helix domain-containing protein [Cyclobacteriaceae bacterium]|nr:winged helix-turn-helix transcriptional regulator [Cyclobacteriaceae bacterium]MCB9236657.1 winged helix-turn-helix transcriptional regulator [Flammeovirgaceae bacterium]MCO5272579.1 winged helix-turn-helix domain-containing protein [Cyclobacteriaceae bacterium]MCW5901935.1 winged helix-turn-helix transcriptional regulator [Cyclobacteriaceae bacterium]